jgi:hypothetical protein
MGYDSHNDKIWACNGATNVIYKINTISNTITNTITATTNGSLTKVYYDPLSYNIYVPTLVDSGNKLFVLSTISETITNTLTGGNYMIYGVLNSSDNRLYISDSAANKIFIINNGNLGYENIQITGDTVNVIGNLSTDGDISTNGDILTNSYLYFGSELTNGSFRMYLSGSTLQVEKRVLGVWTYSGQFT